MKILKSYYKDYNILKQNVITKRNAIEQYEKLKGQFIICGYEVYRLIGVTYDKYDYFYCLYNGNILNCVNCKSSKIIPLKNFIPDEDYNHLVKTSKFRHEDQPTYFMYKIHPKNIINAYVNKHKQNLIDRLNGDEIICGLDFNIDY